MVDCQAYAECDGPNGETALGALGEYTRSLPTDSETVQDTRGGEEEGVAGGESRGKDACVDNVREGLDTSEVDGNNILATNDDKHE